MATRRDLAHYDLERRLQQWAREYGPGGERPGWYGINVLCKFGMPMGDKAAPAHILTDADKVQDVIQAMLATDLYRAAQVLRCDYFYPKAAMAVRLQRLERAGVRMSRSTYERLLELALEHVRSQLFGGA